MHHYITPAIHISHFIIFHTLRRDTSFIKIVKVQLLKVRNEYKKSIIKKKNQIKSKVTRYVLTESGYDFLPQLSAISFFPND